MFSLKNDFISIMVAAKGAELQSLKSNQNALEYMWDGDVSVWGKHSPVLFPIVGTLKRDTYIYNGRAYQLSRHGFARDMMFTLDETTQDKLSFLLQSDSNTFKNYPFNFKFYIDYQLLDNTLTVTYKVLNTGNDMMYFSVGGHPAFKVPLFEGDTYNDYLLQFEEIENIGRWPIAEEGLLKDEAVPFLNNSNYINLHKELFYKDALVFKDLRSKKVKLLSQRNGKGFEFDFTGFPYLGIWAAKDANFVCIEPWCGIADNVQADQHLINKEGINELPAQCVFQKSWSFTIID